MPAQRSHIGKGSDDQAIHGGDTKKRMRAATQMGESIVLNTTLVLPSYFVDSVHRSLLEIFSVKD